MIPIGSILMFHGDIGDRPTGFSPCDGGVHDGFNTPDMRERFVYGALVDGNVDDRSGHSVHLHTIPSTVSSSTHRHAWSVSSMDSVAWFRGGDVQAGTPAWAADHSHTLSGSGNSSYAGAHNHGVANTQSANSLPPFIKAYYIMNTDNGSMNFDDLPVGSIIAWALADIPEDWQLADGSNDTLDLRNRFVYGAENDGAVGDVDGGLQHSHSMPSETSAGGEHSHDGGSVTIGLSGVQVYVDQAKIDGTRTGDHNHGGSSTSHLADGGEHAHDLPGAGVATNIPRHIKLYFIEKVA